MRSTTGQSDSKQWHRGVLISVMLLVAVGSLALLSSPNPKHLMKRLRLVSYQPMEGYFYSEADSEICFELSRNGDSFSAVGGAALSGDLFTSFQGTLTDATSGTATAGFASGSLKSYVVEASDEYFTLHLTTNTNPEDVWKYTRQTSACGSSSFRKIDITPEMLTRVVVTPEMEDPFLKRWNIKRTVGLVKLSLGRMKITASGLENVYNVVFPGETTLSALFEPSKAHFLKPKQLTLQAKVQTTQKIVTFLLKVDGPKSMIIMNADGSPLSLDGAEDDGDDLKSDL